MKKSLWRTQHQRDLKPESFIWVVRFIPLKTLLVTDDFVPYGVNTMDLYPTKLRFLYRSKIKSLARTLMQVFKSMLLGQTIIGWFQKSGDLIGQDNQPASINLRLNLRSAIYTRKLRLEIPDADKNESDSDSILNYLLWLCLCLLQSDPNSFVWLHIVLMLLLPLKLYMLHNVCLWFQNLSFSIVHARF